MEIFMLEIGIMIYLMDLDIIFLQMEKDIVDILKMEIKKEMENIII